jgi:acyl-CoA reductase-like NAD-dependent aldehyde dehydrogenase
MADISSIALKLFGASETAKIIYKAAEIYRARREELERETTEEEFMAMYVDFEEFDDLEEKYFLIEEEETSRIVQFVKEHIEDFVDSII